MKILTVIGNRPQFVKAAAVSRLLREEHEEEIVHTGQHYDDELSRVFFDELGVPAPDRELNAGGGSNTEQTARILGLLEAVLAEATPDLTLVYGDTNSTLAGALAAAQAGVPVAHVEAGMRSFDRSMPEELNRVLADHASDLLLCSTDTAMANLDREAARGEAHLVGDVMADVSLAFRAIAEERSTILEDRGLEPGAYVALTAHRAGNVDDPARLTRLVELIEALPVKTVFPVHPRTRARLDAAGLSGRLEAAAHVELTPPLGYLDFMKLAIHARAVLTDSGGVQKEAYLLGVPCVTLRDTTEWVETVEAGWNTLVDLDAEGAVAALERPSARRGASRAVRRRSRCGADHQRPSHLHFSAMKIGIVGLGYVGLPLAIAFAEEGHDVVGVEADPRRVAAIGRGESYVEDVSSERLAAVADRITVGSGYNDLARTEAVLIAVPTPLTRNREPDLGALVSAGTSLAGVVQRGQLVVLESTTYPGTTRDRLVPLLEESGLAAGRDFHVAFSPERVDPGRTDYTLRTTPKVVGGLTPACLERAVALYRTVCDEVVEVSGPESAELSKLLENVFRSVNIALVNELAMLCDRMGIDIWEVVDAAATKPYGFMRFDPGPGMGGHCLPVDPFYLSWKAREYGQPTEFVELAGEVNQRMPEFCVERISRALNDHSKPVRGSRVAILGVSYKPGVGDLRESPALKIMHQLRERGADLVYHDDYLADLPELELASEPLEAALADADCAVIVTAHPELDLEAVVAGSPLVVDFRGVTRGIEAPNLVRL